MKDLVMSVSVLALACSFFGFATPGAVMMSPTMEIWGVSRLTTEKGADSGRPAGYEYLPGADTPDAGGDFPYP